MAVATRQRVPNKDVAALVRRFNKGFALGETDSKGHFKIVDPEGRPVRRGGRNLTLPSTPSTSHDPHYWKRQESYLVEAGVIGGVEEKRESIRNVERLQEVQEAEAAGSERQQQTATLREQMDGWVRLVGGWDAVGLTVDLAAVATHLTPGYEKSMEPEVSKLKTGQVLTARALAALATVHETISSDSDPRAAFFDLVREARGLKPVELMDDDSDWPFTVSLIPLGQMFADETYQRPSSEQFVRNMVLGFDERLVGTIDVSLRDTGRYAILDGLQRYGAMEILGKQTCWAAVYTGMTIADEARFFFHKNRDRKAVHPYYHFRARLVAGDEDAARIQAAVDGAGFELAVGAAPGKITAIKSVEEIAAMTSEVRDDVLTKTLDTLGEVWGDRKGSTEGNLIRGFGRFFAAFADNEIVWRHWTDALSAFGPQIVLGKARDSVTANWSGWSTRPMAVAAVLAEIHNSGLPRANRLPIVKLRTAKIKLARR